MIVTAVFAILLAITPTGLAAVVVFSVLAFYYALGRYVLPGPPLPRRRQAAKRGLSNNKPRAVMHSKKPWVGGTFYLTERL